MEIAHDARRTAYSSPEAQRILVENPDLEIIAKSGSVYLGARHSQCDAETFIGRVVTDDLRQLEPWVGTRSRKVPFGLSRVLKSGWPMKPMLHNRCGNHRYSPCSHY